VVRLETDTGIGPVLIFPDFSVRAKRSDLSIGGGAIGLKVWGLPPRGDILRVGLTILREPVGVCEILPPFFERLETLKP
jgi:hypothetical protein